jgi:hypothetical protein
MRSAIWPRTTSGIRLRGALAAFGALVAIFVASPSLAAAATLTAEPSLDLDPGSATTVTATGSGLEPLSTVTLAQTIEEDPRLGNSRGYNTVVVTADADGGFAVRYPVTFEQPDGAVCPAPYCKLRAVPFSLSRLAFADLTFASGTAELVRESDRQRGPGGRRLGCHLYHHCLEQRSG